MAFTLSGSTITQSGTDASLSGLAGISGVTVNTLAATSGTFQGVKQYLINSSTNLVINGTLNHDPDSEVLVLQRNDEDQPLAINGTYNFGSSATFQGGTVYQAGCGLVIAGYYTGTQRQFRDTTAGIYVSATGTFNWKGATIFSGRSIISDGALNIQNASFVPRCTDTTTRDYSPRIGFKSGTGGVDELTVEGGNGHFFGVTLGAGTVSPFQGLNVVGNSNFASVIAPEPGDASDFASQFLIVTDIRDLSLGNLYTSRAWQGRFIEFANYAGGVNLKDQLSDKDSTVLAARGAVLATKELSVNFKNATGSNVQGAKFYIAEESDGNEPPSSVNTAFTAENISYLESPQTFILTSDSNGDTTTAKLAIYFGYKMDANPMIDNVRTKAGVNELDAAWISYEHGLGNNTLDVSGQFERVEAITLVRDFSITNTTKTTVDAYTTLETSAKFYDRAKSYLVDNYAGETETLVSRSGVEIDAGSYNVTIDATAASVFAFNGTTITIKASTYTGDMTTTGIITLANGAEFIGTRTDANGTVAPPKVVSITGITAGSRIQIYNVTTATEVVNETVSGTSYTATYSEGTEYSEDDTIRVRLTYASGASAKAEFQSSAVAGASGWGLLVDQLDNTVYNSFGVDGSTITQFQADYLTDQVDVVTGVNFNISNFYAWWVYNLSTENGIRDFFGGITALDEANLRINTGVLSLYLDNSTNTNIRQLDNRRFFRSDGAYPVLDPTTGGGGIDVVWRSQILIAETGVSGLTAAESLQLAEISAVKTKTDQLNFTGTDVKATLDGEEVITDTASREASKADVSGVESDLVIINNGVKKASLLIPHTDDL